MRIGRMIAIQTAVTSGAGILFAIALGAAALQNERGQREVGAGSAALRDALRLTDATRAWIAMSAPVHTNGEPDLVEAAQRQVRVVAVLAGAVERYPQASGVEADLRELINAAERDIARLDRVAHFSRMAAKAPTTPRIAEWDLDSALAVERAERIREHFERTTQAHAQAVARRRAELTAAGTAGAILYLLLATTGLIWVSRRLVHPLEALSATAERALLESSPFSLEERGPTEVRQLTRSLSALAQELEARVDQRTQALCKATEEALVAAEVARSASRAKSQFLANMSHEIRTPLNGVIGSLSLLQSDPLTPRQLQLTQLAARSGEVLLTLINDVLDFSKIEAGKLELENVKFPLGPLVSDLIAMMRSKSEATSSLEISASLATDVPEYLAGDPARLNQVLINLMANAVKFTNKGRVTLGVSLVSLEDKQVVLRFQVSDTGIGIPEGAQSRLFQAFEQADGSTTRRFGGSGLGLAIARQLVERMGGEIGVRSQPGEGSTFWFTARFERVSPLAQTFEFPEDDHTPPALGAVGARILLVDDNEVNRLVGQAMLEAMGCHVQSAEHGRTAVDLWAGGEFDVVLMDCQMPEMDGYDATREIRRRETASGLPRIPVIAVTANALSDERARCVEAGMDDYLSKPFTKDSLAIAVERWYRARRSTSAARPGRLRPGG